MSLLTIGGWLVFISLVISLLNRTSYDIHLRVVGWALISVLALLFAPYFWVYDQSIVQALLAFIGGVYGLFIVRLLAQELIKLRQTTILVTVATGILLAVYTIPSIQWALLHTVASETQMLLELIGYSTSLEQGDRGIFIVFDDTPQELRTQIIVACTGIGSIALFTGFAAAIDTLSWRKRVGIALIMASVIYVLNAIRNVFIAGAYGGQWFHIAPGLIERIFGRGDEWVSYYIADRIIAQVAAVIVLIIFAIGILRLLDDETELANEWVRTIEYTHHALLKLQSKYA